jgi:hypothetical protein
VCKNQTIKSFVSGALLCLFSLSITPKQWLHNIFADHKDFYTHTVGDHLQFTKSGFHCDCDNLVVNTPFIHVDGPNESTGIQIFPAYEAIINNASTPGHDYFFHLRGPPIA